MKIRLLLTLVLLSTGSFAQLTTDQRLADFRNLGDVYAKFYGPTQWKKTLFQFDLLNLSPWMTRVQAVNSDLDFYDLMIEYVSDLQDAHDQYFLPSDFDAYAGVSVDLYDGKVMIDQIDRTLLPASTYPFQIGDQIVSVDGKSVDDLLKLFSKYQTGGNVRTQQRLAAQLILERYQGYYPRAPEVGDTATVVILRQSGATETYNIPWQKSGIPLTSIGATPGPKSAKPQALAAGPRKPAYQQFFDSLHDFTTPKWVSLVGFDELKPVFNLPSNFVQRLGKRLSDYYFTGSYTASDGTRIGYLRIPDFLYAYTPDLDREVRYFQANTDVLVVDVMRNPGGSPCDVEDAIARLTPNPFQGTTAEFRVGWTDLVGVQDALDQAAADGLDDATIAMLQLYRDSFKDAVTNNQGRTQALPVCGATTTRTPVTTAYTKPVLVLIDDLTFSAGEVFAALMQDNQIGTMFGYRTAGAGGVLFNGGNATPVGVYSEGVATVTRGLTVRSQSVVTTDYPTTNYIENVGVRADTGLDYMTADNLVNSGATFVKGFTDAAVKLAAKAGNK